jgi:hypothetical protein
MPFKRCYYVSIFIQQIMNAIRLEHEFVHSFIHFKDPHVATQPTDTERYIRYHFFQQSSAEEWQYGHFQQRKAAVACTLAANISYSGNYV